MVEQTLSKPQGILVVPDGRPPRCSVLVLAGSSGRIETDRVRLLAAYGAAAMSIRWFGDIDQPAGICETPLETFRPALDQLAALSDHLAVIGTSKGAEAALLLGARDRRIRAVAALSPSSVVWANVGSGLDGKQEPYRSSWTEAGQPFPFVPTTTTGPFRTATTHLRTAECTSRAWPGLPIASLKRRSRSSAYPPRYSSPQVATTRCGPRICLPTRLCSDALIMG